MEAENKEPLKAKTADFVSDPSHDGLVHDSDIFDCFMSKAAFKKIYPFYKLHKEFILYAFFGVGTFICSVGSFALLETVMGINELIANAMSWIFAVAFAYVTNKIWVFQSPTKGIKAWFLQAGGFVGGRLGTLALEELILYVFITRLALPSIPVKFVAQIVVIAVNYVISKRWVFK